MSKLLQLAPSDVTYFSQMAGIAATLLGLSFLALTFSLGGLAHRYDSLALPVFLHEVRRKRAKQADGESATGLLSANGWHPTPTGNKSVPAPFDISDLQLFDGDPLVVFIAFSTSLSWNLYFLALIVSLTLVGQGLSVPWLMAVELVAFFGTITYSLVMRHRQYYRLNTYRTGDERLWGPGEVLVVVVCGLEALFACLIALSVSCGDGSSKLCVAALPLSGLAQALALYVVTMRVLCLLAFCLALYVTNKDLFVYFKAKSSEEIRQRWLNSFVEEFPALERRVLAALARMETVAVVAEIASEAGSGSAIETASEGAMVVTVSRLAALWNDGYPPADYIRPEMSPRSDGEDRRWAYLLQGQPGVASWMFDVPGVAAWARDVDENLRQHAN